MSAPTLPPLNALFAFVVAGRHLSFKRAAEMLHVTPGAVSQQIKLLEQHLGCALFLRSNRSLALTAEGERLLLPLREAFQTMSDAVAEVTAPRQPSALIVTTLPSLGTRWLVPRLGRFRRAYPDIEIVINATQRLVDLTQEPMDVGIRHGLGRYPGMHVDRLMASDQYPVCHPKLLSGKRALRHPSDLQLHTLIHGDSPAGWTLWLKTYGVTGVNPKPGPVFSEGNLVLQAALQGEGVALVSEPLVEGDLARGTLVKPFDLPLHRNLAYYLVCLAGRENEPNIRAFRQWVLKEAQERPRPVKAATPLNTRSVRQRVKPGKQASHRTRATKTTPSRRSRHVRAT